MAKKFDFKPLLMQKGEKLGFYVACGLTLVLTIIGVLNALGSKSSASNIAELNAAIKKHEDGAKTAKPSGDQIPGALPPATEDVKLKTADANQFPSNSLFWAARQKDNLRRNPVIFAPTEFQSAYVLANLPSLDFVYEDQVNDKVPSKVAMLIVAKDMGKMGMAGGYPGNFRGAKTAQGLGDLTQSRTGGAGAMGNQAAGAVGAMGGAAGKTGARPNIPRTPSGLRPVKTPKPQALEGKVVYKSLEEAEKAPADHQLAYKALPLRMAVIAASFPYEQQVEEFRQKLGLNTHGEVLKERISLPDKTEWNTFQFRGLVVQRAELVVGKEITENDWVPVPIEDLYRRTLQYTFKQVEKDPKELDVIKDVSRGLVMSLPLQWQENAYPDLVKNLSGVQKTIKAVATGPAKERIVKPSHFIQDDLNPYDFSSTPKKGGTNPVVDNTEKKGISWVTFGSDKEKEEAAKIKKTPIEHCLVRFIDSSLEPGKTYQYRFKVKMANPNYWPEPDKRKDTYKHFAEQKELESDWVVVPQPVVAPPDSLFYLVDTNPRAGSLEAHQIAVQMLRWIESYTNVSKIETPVGDWVEAKRLVMARGEYLRAVVKPAIPFKPLSSPNFDIDKKSPLDFGDDSVLVDFEGGRSSYRRFETETEKGRTFTEDSSLEALVQMPDGRVYARNSTADAKNEIRNVVSRQYDDHIKKIETAKTGVSGGGN